MGDLDLYIHSVYNISSLFFTFNHHNYARWLVVYHNNPMKLQNTHPQVYKDFQIGCFTVKGTSKQFSRVPLDLTLEQTINADAACQRTGINGKVSQEETATFLLDVMETGKKVKDQFIEDCVKDSGRFSRPIKRQKIKNFTTQAGRFKVTCTSVKQLVTVTMTRDLFGSILFHALQAKVNMGEVLQYSLTHVPLSL